MTSPNSRVFRLCKPLNQNYPERVVSFNYEDFTRKQTMIKDPAKKVMAYNCKHIVFILRAIGVAADNVLLGYYCLSDDDACHRQSAIRMGSQAIFWRYGTIKESHSIN